LWRWVKKKYLKKKEKLWQKILHNDDNNYIKMFYHLYNWSSIVNNNLFNYLHITIHHSLEEVENKTLNIFNHIKLSAYHLYCVHMDSCFEYNRVKKLEKYSNY